MRKPDVVHKLYRAFSGLLTDELGCSRMNVCVGGGGGGGWGGGVGGGGGGEGCEKASFFH